MKKMMTSMLLVIATLTTSGANAGSRAYRAYNGLYLSIQESDPSELKTIAAESQKIGPAQSFDNTGFDNQAQLKTNGGLYFSLINSDSGLIRAMKVSNPGMNETFRMVSLDLFSNTWAFVAANGKFLRITEKTDGQWILEATAVTSNIKQAQFKGIWLNGEPVAIRHQYLEKYLRAYDDGTVKFDSRWIGTDETFYRVDLLDGTFAYRSKKNGLYLSADNGLGAITASKDHIDDWELFDHFRSVSKTDYLHTYYGMLLGTSNLTSTLLTGLGKLKDLTTTLKVVELNGRRVALKTQTGTYVGVNLQNQSNLNAEATYIIPETTLRLIDLGYLNSQSSNSIAFKLPNGNYISAKNGGGGKTDTSATQLDSWEIFKSVSKPNGTVGFRSSDKNHFLQAKLGGGGEVNVAGVQPSVWESFDLVDLEGVKVILQNSNTLKDNRCLRRSDFSEEASLVMFSEVGGNQAGQWCGFDYLEIPYTQNDGTKVYKGAFRDSEGVYLTAENGGGEGFNINSNHINVWELFTLEDWGNAMSPVRTVSLSTLDHHYWRIITSAAGAGAQYSEIKTQATLIQNASSFLMRQVLRPTYIQLMK